MKLEDDQMCFVCGKKNPIGLHLEFDIDKDKREIRTVFVPQKNYQGYKDIVHGGIIATVLDEVMVNLVYRLGKPCVSTEIVLRLKRFARVNEEIIFTGRISEEYRRLVATKAKAELSDGTVIAEASGKLLKVGQT